MRTWVFCFIFLVFFLKVASAEVLKEGTIEFEILGVIIPPLSSNQDFTGMSQNLALDGDLSYLNIKWNAYYSDYIDRSIGVSCYINCPNPGDDIDNNCAAYRNSTNYCNYTAITGYGFCTIVNPNYLYNNKLNNVTCSFFNPAIPNVKFLPYLNRTFYPIKFEIFTASNGTVTVGQPLVIGLNVISRGLIPTNFTSNVTIMPNQKGQILGSVENAVSSTPQLRYNQIGKLNPKVTFFSSDKTNVKVLTRAVVDPVICYSDGNCGTDSECVDNRCWKKNIIPFNADRASLPDFTLLGFMQIMLLSSLIVLLIRKK